jgi:hypothetical protein
MLIIFHGYINVVAMGHQHFITRNPNFFDKKFWSKKPPIWFFAPMSNLTKVPFWTSHFGPNYFDWVFLVDFFDRVFLLGFF